MNGQSDVRFPSRAPVNRVRGRQPVDYAMLATCRVVLDAVDAPRTNGAATARIESVPRPRRAGRLFHSARLFRARTASSIAKAA